MKSSKSHVFDVFLTLTTAIMKMVGDKNKTESKMYNYEFAHCTLFSKLHTENNNNGEKQK